MMKLFKLSKIDTWDVMMSILADNSLKMACSRLMASKKSIAIEKSIRIETKIPQIVDKMMINLGNINLN